MQIEIHKNPDQLYHGHPLGPHFFELHDQHVREAQELGEVYELALQRIVDYLAAEPDDKVLRESMALIFGNCGLHILWPAFEAGERKVGKLFRIPRDEKGQNRGIAMDGKQQPFTMLLLEHMGKLVDHYSRETSEEGKAIYGHITRFLKESGLEPNLQRLAAEFCTTCQKVTQGQA